jgi:8-oxo-dGTP pyrophosphatase MutT (NUDIX family)
MAISNRDISSALASYLERYPDEAALLSEPLRLLSRGRDLTSRRSFPVHVTASALLTRGAEVLLVAHRAYGIILQPGGHLDPADVTLAGAAERELAEETGIDPGTVSCRSQPPRVRRVRPGPGSTGEGRAGPFPPRPRVRLHHGRR